MRPTSIVLFERIYLTAVLLSIAGFIFDWEESMETLASEPMLAEFGAAYLLLELAISIAIGLLLWYFIARRASNVARWILVVLTALGTVVLAVPIAAGEYPLDLSGVTGLVVTALSIVAIALLFRSDASRWFERRGWEVDLDVFR